MTRVAVDAMGGDRAPEEIVAGALEAASPQITPVLVGPAVPVGVRVAVAVNVLVAIGTALAVAVPVDRPYV